MSAQSAQRNDNAISNFVDVQGLSRDRPWLLASNRKLRHLQGLSLRNLTLSRPSARPRGKTIDDESLPGAFRTPTKLLAQRENHKLEYSRSSSDLQSPRRNELSRKDDSDTDVPTKLRPSPTKLRRRSTLNWTNALPRVRQKKLEDVTVGKMADTWFSLHCAHLPEPVYISEVVEKAMNPNFRFFDLNAHGPFVTRGDELTIKCWARTEIMDDYILLIELRLNLRSLQFIGKTLESFHHPFPENCIIFHLSDGIYTSFTDLPLNEPVPINRKSSKSQLHEAQPTSSFDALMRLINLDNCIQDALSTQEKITAQINKLQEANREALETIDSATQSQEALALTNRSVSSARKLLKSAQSRRSDLQASLETRRSTITSGTLIQEKAQSDLDSAKADLSSRTNLLQSTRTAVFGQIRRICEDLMCIYPIEPVPQKQLLFTIRDLLLPNATSPSLSSSEADSATTAAALSWVAHVVHLLSLYLSTPVPYPPNIHGSTSSILDPVSTTLHSLPARTFPLYQKGAATFRFEYGVFLLNSDIELLMSRQGLRMVDQRQTLPNLKYLLYVLTAGRGELPIRTKGDVRGLMHRRDSDENPSETGNSINNGGGEVKRMDGDKT